MGLRSSRQLIMPGTSYGLVSWSTGRSTDVPISLIAATLQLPTSHLPPVLPPTSHPPTPAPNCSNRYGWNSYSLSLSFSA